MREHIHEVWELFKKVLRDTHINPNNKYAWEKVAGSGSVACYLWFCYHRLVDDNIFTPVEFATGLSIIIGVVCGGTAIKYATRPTDPVPKEKV